MSASATPRPARPNISSPSPSTSLSNSPQNAVIKPPPPPPQLAALLSAEDLRDKSLMAIFAALSSVNNQALCVKELVDVCRSKKLHALGGATPSGTLNSAIRNHLNRCAERSTPCMLSRHILSGEANDDRLAPAIGARLTSQTKPGEEKSYHCNKNGRTRKGVCLWFLSEWTGYQSPFAREGFTDVIIHTEGGPAPSPSPDDAAARATREHSRVPDVGVESEDEEAEVNPVPETKPTIVSTSHSLTISAPAPMLAFRPAADLISSSFTPRGRSLSPAFTSHSDSDNDGTNGSMDWENGFDRLDLQNFTWSGEPDDDLETILSTPRSASLDPECGNGDEPAWVAGPRISNGCDSTTFQESGMIAEEDDGSGWEDGYPLSGRTVSSQLLHPGKAEAAGPHNGLMLTIPVKATLPRANASDPTAPLDMAPDELSPFTPASSSFNSTPGTEHSFAGDQELPFSSIEPREDWPSNVPRAPDLLDLNSQNGTECRQHDEDIQDLLVGPEGALLDELEEAWGQPYPNHLSMTTLTRYCPGMCVPMHTRCRGRSRSTSFDRSMRDAKYCDLGAQDALNMGPRTSRVLSLPNISLESYLVAGTASPPPAGLTLRDDGSLSTLNHMLEKPIVINTREPVQPPIHVTLVDSLPVFVTTYANGVSLLRQMDSDYINLSALVSIARPPLSPSETTQLIESCLTRRVIPRRSTLPSSSGSLAGTWVPLPDAQAFCVSGRLKIPGKILEHFLQDDLADLFPDPLPELARAFRSAGVNMTDFNSLAIPSDPIVSDDIQSELTAVSGPALAAERSNTSLSDGVVVSTGGSVPKRRPGRPKATAASRSRRIAATAPVTTRQQSRPNTRAGLRSAGLS